MKSLDDIANKHLAPKRLPITWNCGQCREFSHTKKRYMGGDLETIHCGHLESTRKLTLRNVGEYMKQAPGYCPRAVIAVPDGW